MWADKFAQPWSKGLGGAPGGRPIANNCGVVDVALKRKFPSQRRRNFIGTLNLSESHRHGVDRSRLDEL